jgi:hypothetical protein
MFYTIAYKIIQSESLINFNWSICLSNSCFAKEDPLLSPSLSSIFVSSVFKTSFITTINMIVTINDIIKTMNLEPDKLPDLDNISLISGDTDRRGGGITLNL